MSRTARPKQTGPDKAERRARRAPRKPIRRQATIPAIILAELRADLAPTEGV